MRRPMCLAALVFTVIVFLRLKVFPLSGDYPSDRFAEYDGQSIVLTGVIADLQDKYDAEGNMTQQMTLENLQMEVPAGEAQSVIVSSDNKALCTVDETNIVPLKAGEKVKIRGKLRCFSRVSNDGGFDSRLYYSVQNISFRVTGVRILDTDPTHNRFRTFLYSVRTECGRVIDAYFPDKEAGILRAMLLGETGRISPEEKNLLQNNGIIHVAAISGLHISTLGYGLFALLRKLRCPKWPASVISVLFILLYAMMTGLRSSAVRAMIMFALRMLAPLIGRTYDILSALSLSCLLLLIEQPLLLLHSGFQFSFCAVLSVCILLPRLPSWLKPFSVPVAALPVQLCSYYTFSPYSLLINLLVIPLMSAVLVSGVFTVLAGILLSCLSIIGPLPRWLYMVGVISSYPASLILRFYLRICETADSLPGHQFAAGNPAPWLVVLYAAMLALVIWIGKRREDAAKAVRRKLALVQAGLLLAGILCLLFVRTGYPLEVYFLDVGQGDCEVIRVGGSCILIDGGSSDKTMVGRYTAGPFLYYHGISSIDIAVVTHEDLDHCSGLLELLEAEADSAETASLPKVRRVVLPFLAQSAKGAVYQKIENLCHETNIPVCYMHRGEKIAIGKAELACLHPEKEAAYEETNAGSLVFLLRYEQFSCLFTGDLEGEGEEDFLSYMQKEEPDSEYARTLEHLTVLKAAHHGSRFATSEDFLRRVNAAFAVISCGVNNRYGHPSEETVDRLLGEEMQIYDTRYTGQISVYTDGEKVKIDNPYAKYRMTQ